MTVSTNRYQDEKHKKKVKRRIQEIWQRNDLANDKKFVAKQSAVHMRGCSCYFCRKSRHNPWFKGKNKFTIQERRFDEDQEDWIDE